jgi:hypothetical protein
MASAATVVKSKKQETYKVTFNNLTQGEVIALKNALGLWGERSQVASDVGAYLNNALETEGSPRCLEIRHASTPSFDEG